MSVLLSSQTETIDNIYSYIDMEKTKLRSKALFANKKGEKTNN
jgi:hypothetical protein